MNADAIDIIIPVYKNLGLTQRCLDSVLRANDPAMGDLYLINDASPEPALSNYCREVAAEGRAILIEHAENLGFVRSVNEGFEKAQAHDVVILNSDTEVPPRWLSRLHQLAQQHPGAGSITPFSNNATICSYPHFCEDNDLPEGLCFGELDAFFEATNAGLAIEIPTGVGFCMFLRRAALSQVGFFDHEAFGRGYGEENDWCLRATAAGWQHYLAAGLFVYHAGGASFGGDAEAYQNNALTVIRERYPHYEKDIAAFIQADPIEGARHAVDLVRSDVHTVIKEYQRRERLTKDSLHALDRERHEQVVALQGLLHTTRESAKEEGERYQALLSSQREETAAAESQYQTQLESMAAEYQAISNELSQLNRFWPVRVRNWLLRRLGRL